MDTTAATIVVLSIDTSEMHESSIVSVEDFRLSLGVAPTVKGEPRYNSSRSPPHPRFATMLNRPRPNTAQFHPYVRSHPDPQERCGGAGAPGKPDCARLDLNTPSAEPRRYPRRLRNASGHRTPIQHCPVHMKRSITKPVTKALHAGVRKALHQAWEFDNSEMSEADLRSRRRLRREMLQRRGRRRPAGLRQRSPWRHAKMALR
jgi:hypothetical protein